MANVQIYQLDNVGSDLDSGALLACDVEINGDKVTRKVSVSALETQILNTEEYTTDLDTTAKTITGAINELKSGMVGHYSTGVIKFNSLNWTQSASGMYYASIDLDSYIPSGKSIIGITIEGWNNLRVTDIVVPYIRTSRTIGIMSNVNSFADVNTGYGYSILYV